jgi:hypothetical protein
LRAINHDSGLRIKRKIYVAQRHICQRLEYLCARSTRGIRIPSASWFKTHGVSHIIRSSIRAIKADARMVESFSHSRGEFVEISSLCRASVQPPCEIIGAKWITDPITTIAPRNQTSDLRISPLERCIAISHFSQNIPAYVTDKRSAGMLTEAPPYRNARKRHGDALFSLKDATKSLGRRDLIVVSMTSLARIRKTSKHISVNIPVLSFPTFVALIEAGFVFELDHLARFDILPILDHSVLDGRRIVRARGTTRLHRIIGTLRLAIEIGAFGKFHFGRKVKFYAGMTRALDVDPPEPRHVEILNFGVRIKLLLYKILEHLAGVVIGRLATKQTEGFSGSSPGYCNCDHKRGELLLLHVNVSVNV